MTENQLILMQLLFNPEELISVSPDKFAYNGISQEALQKDRFLLQPNNQDFSPRLTTLSEISLIVINPISGNCCDANVSSHRTFLVEMDEGTIEEQSAYIETFNTPKTAIIFSGGKSLHYLITLADVTLSSEQWRFVNQWILNILKKVDQQVKNPSRKTRFPDHLRNENSLQELKFVGKRIPFEELSAWLNRFPDVKPEWKSGRTLEKVNRAYHRSFGNRYREIPRWLKCKLEEGVYVDRNQTWFKYSCVLAESGFDEDEILEFYEEYFIAERDFTQRELEACVRSAIKRFEGGGDNFSD